MSMVITLKTKYKLHILLKVCFFSFKNRQNFFGYLIVCDVVLILHLILLRENWTFELSSFSW